MMMMNSAVLCYKNVATLEAIMFLATKALLSSVVLLYFRSDGDHLCNMGLTFILRAASFCLKMMSHTSSTPSILVVQNTAGLTGLQQPSERRCS